MKQRSRLQQLIFAINRWLELPKCSRSIICGAIVEAVDELGLADVLAKDGITFNRTDDLYNDMRVNAQKIFRWLGQYEGTHAFPDRLFHLEQAILAAMPENIRLDYLNDIYGMMGLVVCSSQSSTTGIDSSRMAATLTKEQMEAQVSVIELGIAPEFGAAKRAHREVSEAVAVGSAVLGELERKFPNLKSVTH
jgi:hypothetical protein